MDEIVSRNEFCLLIGDLNKLVGCDEYGVPGNHPEVSPGGKLLRELLMTGKWFLVNGMGVEVVEGAPFTRVDPATGTRSCLDLFVVSSSLRLYIKKLIIDSKRNHTVPSANKNMGSPKLLFSDHFSCLLTFSNLPRKKTNKIRSRYKSKMELC